MKVESQVTSLPFKVSAFSKCFLLIPILCTDLIVVYTLEIKVGLSLKLVLYDPLTNLVIIRTIHWDTKVYIFALNIMKETCKTFDSLVHVRLNDIPWDLRCASSVQFSELSHCLSTKTIFNALRIITNDKV